VATLAPDGTVIPGAWIHPQVGSTRFKTRKLAREVAENIALSGCFETKVEKEPSRSRPGKFAWQVYLRSMGYIEGLVRQESSP
jgi:hypothetical protein